MEQTLRIALPKGRIFEEAIELFRASGYDLSDDFVKTRKLHVVVPQYDFELILAKPMDVPTYVAYGVADIGVAGGDVLMENDKSVYELLDLEISKCYLAIAGLPNHEPKNSMPKIATKYPKISTEYFRKKGTQVEIIPLNGSIELAPLLGLSDYIVDIVSTGNTLRENGLVEYEQIGNVSSRFIANRASYRLKEKRIQEIIQAVQQTLERQKEAAR